MVVNVCFSWSIEDGLLLLFVGLAWKVHALIHSDVHLLNKDAIRRDPVTLLDVYNISNDKVSDLN